MTQPTDQQLLDAQHCVLASDPRYQFALNQRVAHAQHGDGVIRGFVNANGAINWLVEFNNLDAHLPNSALNEHKPVPILYAVPANALIALHA
jgi:hypothetical protein